MKKDRIIITCGKFDPINRDELDFLRRCRQKGDWLIVGIHSDWWMCSYNGGFFQSFETRKEIVSSIKYVDEIFKFNDSDGTACILLKLVKTCYPNSNITFISEEDMHDMPETKIRGITFETMK